MSALARRRWLALSLLLLASFAASVRLQGHTATPLRQPLSQFPNTLPGWQLVDQPALTPDVLAVLKADDYMDRDYRDAAGAEASLFVAYYRAQHAGDAMHSPKNCLPGGGWEPILNDTVALADGRSINRYVVENSGDRAMVLYWYQAQSRIIASEYAVKAFLVWNGMRTGRRDGAIVRVLAPMAPYESVPDATRLALSLANASLGPLQQFLPR